MGLGRWDMLMDDSKEAKGKIACARFKGLSAVLMVAGVVQVAGAADPVAQRRSHLRRR